MLNYLKSITLIFFFTLLLSLSSLPAQADGGEWVSHGPYGGNVSVLAIDPVTPTTMYAGTSAGVFKSIDGGTTWTDSGSGLPNESWGVYVGTNVSALVINPTTPTTLYAGTGDDVYKSTNGGATWTASDTGLTNTVRELVIDPNTPTTLYASTDYEIWGGGGVFKSNNGGDNWTAVNTGLPNLDVRSMAIDPINSSTLYVGIYGEGVFKSTDGGANWAAINTGFSSDQTVFFLAVDPVTPTTLYAAVVGGIYKSTDGGANWGSINTGLSALGDFYSLIIDPGNSSTLYVSGSGGIYKSIDGGAGWAAVNSGLVNTYVSTLAINPTDSNTIFAGAGGVFKSVNGGATWAASSTGMTAIEITKVVVDPNTPSILYAIGNDYLFKSTDNGITWGASASPTSPGGYCIDLLIDPTTPNILYASTIYDGVFKSTDSGATWTAINTGLTDPDGYEYTIYSLAIDPATPATLYAGSEGHLFISVDGGASWRESYDGLDVLGGDIRALAVDPATPDTLYAGASEGDWRGEGVFKSTDGGDWWDPVNTGLLASDEDYAGEVNTLAIDPVTPTTLYAGLQPRNCSDASTCDGGVYKSTNGGNSWIAANAGLTNFNVQTLLINPVTPTTLYAGTNSYSYGTTDIFKSVDGGANWTALNTGLVAVNTLAINPDTGTIHAGGWGVYSFTTDRDTDGIGNDQENAAPNNGDGNNDGIPDSQQDNVTSLPNAGGSAYLTLAAPDSVQLNNVQVGANPSPGDSPQGVGFSQGFLNFGVTGLTVSQTFTVTLILHQGDTPASYWKYGPTPDNTTPHWYEFTYDGTTGATISGNVVTLHFKDGVRGDSDLTANGQFNDPGAPAFPADTSAVYLPTVIK